MSEELYKRFQSAMSVFTRKHGLEFDRCNARTFNLKPVQGGRSAALQINFESGFWDLYSQIAETDLPSLHKNLLRQIDGYNPSIRLQFAQTFYMKAEAVRRWHANKAPESKLSTDNRQMPAVGGVAH